jgi:hypothetical protein
MWVFNQEYRYSGQTPCPKGKENFYLESWKYSSKLTRSRNPKYEYHHSLGIIMAGLLKTNLSIKTFMEIPMIIVK